MTDPEVRDVAASIGAPPRPSVDASRTSRPVCGACQGTGLVMSDPPIACTRCAEVPVPLDQYLLEHVTRQEATP